MKTQIITATAFPNQYFSTKIRHECYFEQKIRSSSSYSSSSAIIIIRCSQRSRGGSENENKKKKKKNNNTNNNINILNIQEQEATTGPKPSPSPSGPQLFYNPFQPANANANNIAGSKRDDVAVEEEEEEKIPQVVFERMALRILAYVGVPIAVGFLSLQVIGMVSEKKIWEVPKWISFAAILLTFGSSSLGVAFGALSTSWDPNKEGSLLGFNEFRQNWDEMWESNKKI